MRPGLFPLLRMALALVVGLSAGLVGAPAASAALGFRPCPGQEAFGCARLSVPLDRSGHVPGSVSLSVRRLRTGPTQSPDAVVALAGGPGQAAVPLASTLRHLLAPALAQRDLLVFDQRGTGASSPLTCPSLAQARVSMGAGVLGCAQHLGLGRGSFTTLDSVADIEAVRQASGYAASSWSVSPTAPRSPWSTPSAIPRTSRAWFSIPSCPPMAPIPCSVPPLAP